MRLVVDVQELAVRGHDLRGEEVVDRHAVLADEEADPSAERDAADADRARVAEAGREAVLPGGVRVLAGRESRLGPRRAAVRVDVQRLHRRQVEDDPSLGDAEARPAVAAAPDGELAARVARERHHGCDLPSVDRPDDDGRMPVDVAGEHRPRGVVAGVLGSDHLAAEILAELRDRDRAWFGDGSHRNLLRSWLFLSTTRRRRPATPAPDGRFPLS